MLRLQPTKAKLVSITEQPTIIDHAVWNNSEGDSPTHYEAEINTSVSDTVEDSWERSQSVSISAEVGVSVGPAEAKTSVAYESSWGVGGSKSKTTDVGASDSISKDVPAGEMVLAALVGQRGTVTVEVDYKLSIPTDGHVLVHTTGKNHLGHTGAPVWVNTPGGGRYPASWLLVPLSEILKKSSTTSKQTIHTGFFADANLATFPLSHNTPKGIDAAVGGTELEQIYP